MKESRVKVLLLGDYLHPDFAGVREYLAGETQLQVLESCSPTEAPGSCDAIAICPSRPGQFSQRWIEEWHARAPLARLLAILGSWCEGEMRSGHPWHGVERVYWYDAIGRLRSLRNLDPSVYLQRTLTAAERIERDTARWPKVAQSAVIFARRRSDYEPLADICQIIGASPRWERSWQPTGATPDLLVASLDDLQAGPSVEALARLCSAWPAARRIALMNFPRRDEAMLLQQAGFDHILGKPLMVADLLSCLTELALLT